MKKGVKIVTHDEEFLYATKEQRNLYVRESDKYTLVGTEI